MASIYLNEKFLDSPEAAELGGAACWLLVSAACYCSRLRTDWFVPTGIVPRLTTIPNPSKHAARLVGQGFMERVDGGYRITCDLFKIGPQTDPRPHISDATRLDVYDRDGHRCVQCGATEYLSLDHIVPFSRGGADTATNLQTLCRSCNSRKGARI